MKPALLLATAVIGMCACGDVGRVATDAPDSGVPDDSGMSGNPDATPTFVTLQGSVVDLDKSALPGVGVELCAVDCQSGGACTPGCKSFATDGAGTYSFPHVASGGYVLRVGMSGAVPPDRIPVLVPLYLYYFQEAVRALPPLVYPRAGKSTPLVPGKQTVAIDGTLTLTVDGGKLTLPAGSGPPHLAGVRIPKPLIPDFCVPTPGGNVLAVWALAPFGASSSVYVPLHVADTLGLPLGTRVNLFTVDPQTGRPSQFGSSTVAQNGIGDDLPDFEGMNRFTWLILAIPGGGP